MNTKNKLADMPIQPLLYTMAVPLMLSLLVQSLYNIVDSMFVAKLSETALTAASLVYSIQFLSISFVFAAVPILCGYFASGLGNGMVNMLSAAIRQLILLIPCLWFFIKTSGITHGWYAFWIAEIVACIYSYCTSHKLLKNISQ